MDVEHEFILLALEQEMWKKDFYIKALLNDIAEAETWLRHSESFQCVCELYGLRMNWRDMRLELKLTRHSRKAGNR